MGKARERFFIGFLSELVFMNKTMVLHVRTTCVCPCKYIKIFLSDCHIYFFNILHYNKINVIILLWHQIYKINFYTKIIKEGNIWILLESAGRALIY